MFTPYPKTWITGLAYIKTSQYLGQFIKAYCKNLDQSRFCSNFSDLGNTDEFSTEMMEWRLARSDLVSTTATISM